MHAADASGYFVLFYNIFPNYYNEPDRAGNLLMRSIRKDPAKHREIIQLELISSFTDNFIYGLSTPAELRWSCCHRQPFCQSQRDLKGKVCEMYACMAGRIHFSHQLGRWAGFRCDSWEKEEKRDKRWVGQLFPPPKRVRKASFQSNPDKSGVCLHLNWCMTHSAHHNNQRVNELHRQSNSASGFMPRRSEISGVINRYENEV